MVWCWQQDPEDRPSADGIITATSSEQFPRLLDGIRACNAGQVCVYVCWCVGWCECMCVLQVTASCVRLTTPSSGYGGGRGRGWRLNSPSALSFGSRNSYTQSPQPLSLQHRPLSDTGGFPLSPPPQEESEGSSPSGPSPFSPQRRVSIDEPRSKYLWSPRISEAVSHRVFRCHGYCFTVLLVRCTHLTLMTRV